MSQEILSSETEQIWNKRQRPHVAEPPMPVRPVKTVKPRTKKGTTKNFFYKLKKIKYLQKPNQG